MITKIETDFNYIDFLLLKKTLNSTINKILNDL